jgi:hypothetical protein
MHFQNTCRTLKFIVAKVVIHMMWIMTLMRTMMAEALPM